MGQSNPQKTCFDQAAKVADKSVSYSNHYDARTKTCWVEEWTNTTSAQDHVVYSRWVFNAFEKNSTESYFFGELGKAPYICYVGSTHCISTEDFDQLVNKKYGFGPQ